MPVLNFSVAEHAIRGLGGNCERASEEVRLLKVLWCGKNSDSIEAKVNKSSRNFSSAKEAKQ